MFPNIKTFLTVSVYNELRPALCIYLQSTIAPENDSAVTFTIIIRSLHLVRHSSKPGNLLRFQYLAIEIFAATSKAPIRFFNLQHTGK